MKCSKCGTDFQGNFCPNCATPAPGVASEEKTVVRRSTPPKKKKKWPIVLAIVAAVIIIAAIGGSGNDGPKKIDDVPQTQQPSNTPEAKTEFSVGEKVELNNIVVTFTGVTTNTGNEFNKPNDGNVFALCSFEIDNNSDKDIAISSLMSFDAYVDDYSTNMSLTSQITSNNQQLDGKVSAGKKIDRKRVV